jgi:hypothetical protein
MISTTQGKKKPMNVQILLAVLSLAAISISTADASTLQLDDTRNTLDWRGVTYKIRGNADCGRYGWRVEGEGTSFDFCTATQGYADFQLRGVDFQCDMKR